DGRADHRRRGGRDAGHARRGARPPDPQEHVPGALDGAEPAHGPREGGGLSDAATMWGGAAYEECAATMAAIHDRVAVALAPQPGERILDLACGTGPVAIKLARAGAEVVGLDISPDQLAKSRVAARDEGVDVRFDEGDCQELPYADGSFDATTST